MIVSSGALSASAICEQAKAQPKTPAKRRITSLPDDQSIAEPR